METHTFKIMDNRLNWFDTDGDFVIFKKNNEVFVTLFIGDEILNSPKYKHDCSKCIFLYHSDGHDLYFCEQGSLPTIIARYGNSGEEYTSGRNSQIPVLRDAENFCIKIGLMESKGNQNEI